MSKASRMVKRHNEQVARKALRLSLKDETNRAFIIATQKQYFKMGYEKGYADGQNTKATETAS